MLEDLRRLLLPIVERQRDYDLIHPRVNGASIGIIGAGPGVQFVPEDIRWDHDRLLALNGAAKGLSWDPHGVAVSQWDDIPWTGHAQAPWGITSDRGACYAPDVPMLIFPHELPVGVQGCLPRTILALRVLGAAEFVCYGCDGVLGRNHLHRYDTDPGSLSYYRQQGQALWASLGASITWRYPEGRPDAIAPLPLAWTSGP